MTPTETFRPGQQEFTKDFDSVMSIIKWNCLGFLFLDFFIPFVISQQLHINGLGLGLVFSIQTLGDVCSAPIAGWLTDRISKPKLVLFGANGRAFAYVLMYISVIFASYWGLVVAEFSLGFMVTFFWVPISTIIAQKSNKRCRSYAFGKRRFAQGTGILIGTTFSVVIFILANTYAPGNVFLPSSSLIVFGIANTTAGISFYRHVDEHLVLDPKLECDEQKGNMEGNVGSKDHKKTEVSRYLLIGFALLCLAVFLTETNQSCAKPFFRVYLLVNIEPDENLALLALIPGQLISLFLAPRFGKYADRVNPFVGMTIICTCGALVTLITILANNVFVFASLQVFDQSFALTSGLIVENLMSRVSLKHRGKIFGVKSFMGNLGAIFGPTIGGLLWDTVSSTAPFTFSIFVELSLIPIYFLVLRFIKRDLAESFDEGEKKAVEKIHSDEI
nr:MFS transporter [Candidatus Sigynarchaeota archaeon]